MSTPNTNLWSTNPIGAGLLSAAGGIAGAFPQNTSMSGSASGTTNLTSSADALSQLINAINQTQTGQQTTTLSPEAQTFMNTLMQHYGNLAASGVDMSGYAGAGETGINQSFNGAQNNLDASLAARGLSTSPVAGAATANLQAQRAGQLGQFKSSIPLLSQQLQLQNLAGASGFLSQVPRNVSTVGNLTGMNTQTGNQTQTGSSLQSQNSSQNYKQSSGGGIGGLLGGLASVAGSLALASDRRIKENIEDDTTSPELAHKAVMKLRPKTFNFKGEGLTEGHHGFIAQDVEKVMPHAVKNIGGIKHIDFGEMMPTLVKAIQHMGKMKEMNIAKGATA